MKRGLLYQHDVCDFIKGQSFETKEEAIAATVAKLKEVCDEN